MHKNTVPLILAAFGSLGIGVYISYPPPSLSKNLKEWKQMGQFLDWNGRKVFYIDIKGQGEAGTVLCLHGFPTSSFDWVKILPALKKNFSRIVLLDFLGFGFSDKPINITYTITEQADIAENLLLHQKIDSVHVLSHDYGDTVALEILARHNSAQLGVNMLSLSMLNGGIFPNTHYPRPLQKLLLTPVIGQAASYLFNYILFCRGFGEVFGLNKPTNSDFEDFWAAMRFNNGDRASYKVINFLRERQQYKDRWVGALVSTNLKVLMIYGPADPVNPPSFATHFRQVVPSQTIVTLDSSIGHYPQWEDPIGVSEALHDFITDLSINV